MNKTVLITGASSGIGKMTAIYFHEMGWNVAASMRSPEKEKDLVEFEKIKCIALDVLDQKTIESSISKTIEAFGGIDVLVNCAGFDLVGPFESTQPEKIKAQFDTNVFGAMNVIRAVLPHFRSRHHGVIINLTLGEGRLSLPLNSVHHASKAALQGFSEGLQLELRPFDIKIKTVEPTAVTTDFYGRSQDVADSRDQSTYREYVDLTMPNLQFLGVTGIEPGVVAAKIYKAATDSSWRLRYPIGSGASILYWLKSK
ncbi:MAG: SDR family oxidoreductase, partial [Cyclobacteriaceae bacterium]